MADRGIKHAGPTPQPTARPPRALDTLAEIKARYGLPGPHATVLLPTPVLGSFGDDLEIRWSATKKELSHLGASPAAIAELDATVMSLTVHGAYVLLTANDDSAAAAWITRDDPPCTSPGSTVGELPALVAAVRESIEVIPIIAAVVDRLGADIYDVGRTTIESIITVDGEHDFVHKAASGGWSQPRQQRHSETVWARNADLVAEGIVQECRERRTRTVLLTGDERAVGLVRARLEPRSEVAVEIRKAGARGDTSPRKRLREAADDVRRAAARAHVQPLTGRLHEELGQRDRAIDGAVGVLEAITENRVGTLFVEAPRSLADATTEASVKAALDHGADIVIAPSLRTRDGIAALLRNPY